jgi:CRISPR associated protein Cas2 family
MEGTMTDYTLAFDLVNEQSSHDYEPLWTELKQLGGHRTQYSLWLINVNNTAKETCDQLRNLLDKGDRVWVLELTANHYFANATGGTNDWIKNNPPSR